MTISGMACVDILVDDISQIFQWVSSKDPEWCEDTHWNMSETLSINVLTQSIHIRSGYMSATKYLYVPPSFFHNIYVAFYNMIL